MREPPFWWRKAGAQAALLAPAAAIYGAVAARRLARDGQRVGVPVVCIGNLTVGGAGKTPTAIAVARMLAEAGTSPALLSRGYGGRLDGPVTVDPASHSARDVGDEALLLARAAPTIVARDRLAGARAAVAAGAQVIVMDDGFQNPALVKDFSILVVDGRRGIGNGRIIPAGPLRAPLPVQLARADAIVAIGEPTGSAAALIETAARTIPIFSGSLSPDARALADLTGQRVLAFAGIGDPDKFFATLRDGGIVIDTERRFADHHRYTPANARMLCGEARIKGLALVTTEKDLVRLQGDAAVAELAAQARALPVTLSFDDGLRRMLLERAARSPNAA